MYRDCPAHIDSIRLFLMLSIEKISFFLSFLVDKPKRMGYSIDIKVREDDMTVDTVKAKASWSTAGLNEQGMAAIGAWIDKMAANVQAGGGRWDAFAKFATYDGHDPMGSVKLLKSAVDQIGK